MNKEISKEQLKDYRNEFLSNDKLKVSQRAVIKNGIFQTAENPSAVINTEQVFSYEIKTNAVTAQKKSGRCWIFAAFNLFRHKFSKEFKCKEFELSQTYTFFWDKIEKANYFYEEVLKTANEATDSRYIRMLFDYPQGDGGYWDMVVNLVEKYGVVPKYVMPDTAVSIESPVFNAVLNKKLRKDGIALRKMIQEGKSSEEIGKVREVMLKDIYKIVSTSLGTPPENFTFQYRDDDKNYHCDTNITPKEFYDKYIGVKLEDYVSLINVPSNDKKYLQQYTYYYGNVVGAPANVHINVEMQTLKDIALKHLQSGESAWYACDVAQSYSREKGIMSHEMYDIDGTFDIDLTMTKAEKFEFRESIATHAMALVGVDIIDGKPTKWKVENSWGDELGKKGFFVMTDEWMDEFTYEVIVKKEFLTDEVKKALETEPIMLEPWDGF